MTTGTNREQGWAGPPLPPAPSGRIRHFFSEYGLALTLFGALIVAVIDDLRLRIDLNQARSDLETLKEDRNGLKARTVDLDHRLENALKERDAALALHPILQAMGSGVWAYSQHTLKRGERLGAMVGTFRFDYIGIEGEGENESVNVVLSGIDPKTKAHLRHVSVPIPARVGCRNYFTVGEAVYQVVIEDIPSLETLKLGIGASAQTKGSPALGLGYWCPSR